MFTPQTSPFGTDPSTVSASFFVPPVPATADKQLNVYLVFTDESTSALVGQSSAIAGGGVGVSFCCTGTMYSKNACSGAPKGGLIVAAGGTPAPVVGAFTGLSVAQGSRGSYNFTVASPGSVWLTTVVCEASGDALPANAPVEVSARFRNPYGFLPGTQAGLLPWYGVLLACYLLLLVTYAVLMCVNRSYVLPLQYMVLGVIVTGTLEMMVSLGTFNSKNATGVPTPCNICPITSDYITAVVLNVLKRAVSRVLLLAVSMGFGVIYPSLPTRVTLGLGAMGALYAIAGIVAAVQAETTYDDAPSSWELPVFALDLVFLALIQAHHTRTTTSLKESNQTEKLRMYSRLVRVVMANVIAHILLTVVVLGIRGGHVALDWRALFVLAHFWDALYFLVLLAGAVIWAPGPTAYRYAWYAQPDAEGAIGGDGPDQPDKEEGEEEVEVELGPMQAAPPASGSAASSSSSGGSSKPSSGSARATSSTSSGGKPVHPPGTFVISAEEDAEEEEEKKKARSAIPIFAQAADVEAPDMLEESDRKRLTKSSSSSLGGGGGGKGGKSKATLPGATI
jgi:hypothetical protein